MQSARNEEFRSFRAPTEAAGEYGQLKLAQNAPQVDVGEYGPASPAMTRQSSVASAYGSSPLASSQPSEYHGEKLYTQW